MSQALNRRAFLGRSLTAGAGLAVLGAGGGTLLSACGSSSPSSSASTTGGAPDFGTLDYQLSWIKNVEFAGQYIADTNGYYTDGGFSGVSLMAGGPTVQQDAVVASGKALLGIGSPDITAPAILKGAPLKIIGATFQKNPFCITSLTKDPIATPQDMIGKKIGVQAANTAIFEGLLKANNIDKSKLTIVPVQFDPTVLTTGDVQGFVSYLTNEPITLAAAGNEVTTFAFAENGLPLVAETFTVLQETIDKDRDKLKAYLTAEIKGWKDAIADPAGTAELAVEKYGKDQKLAVEEQTKEAQAQNKLIVSADTEANGLFTMTDELIAQNIEALNQSGATITADKIFDLSLLKEIYAADASLI